MSDKLRHIHLDCIGGIAGDMFVAAMLDCWPQKLVTLQTVLEQAGFADLVTLSVEEKNDGVLRGSLLSAKTGKESEHHRQFVDIREELFNSKLDDSTKVHALGIFQCLAEAEAAVHGVSVEEVSFHEVGAWDSIADIVLASWLIDHCEAESWSVSSLPLGSGQVETAHGRMPVPAPAVMQLLEGFRFHDDGLEGERVTPTGAAILQYLDASVERPSGPRQLHRSGFGFGTRSFPGISNVVRASVFTLEESDVSVWETQSITGLAFEVDDQTPEDLSSALDQIRAQEGVLDVLQYSALGKKGRTVSCVRIQVEHAEREAVLACCFDQCTTLGIREERITRQVLHRMNVTVEVAGKPYRVKLAQRPSGEFSMKVEMDDLKDSTLSHEDRNLLRAEIEQQVVELLNAQAD